MRDTAEGRNLAARDSFNSIYSASRAQITSSLPAAPIASTSICGNGPQAAAAGGLARVVGLWRSAMSPAWRSASNGLIDIAIVKLPVLKGTHLPTCDSAGAKPGRCRRQFATAMNEQRSTPAKQGEM